MQARLDKMSKSAYKPEHLSEADLKKLLLEALEDVPDWNSPETFHARFDHPERVIQISYHIGFIVDNMAVFGCVGTVQANCAFFVISLLCPS